MWELAELRELRVFFTLYEELHFGRTAERLRLSQTRISQTIHEFETKIGTPLFVRTSRRVAPTLGRPPAARTGPAYLRAAPAGPARDPRRQPGNRGRPQARPRWPQRRWTSVARHHQPLHPPPPRLLRPGQRDGDRRPNR